MCCHTLLFRVAHPTRAHPRRHHGHLLPRCHTLLFRVAHPTEIIHLIQDWVVDKLSHPTFSGHSSNGKTHTHACKGHIRVVTPYFFGSLLQCNCLLFNPNPCNFVVTPYFYGSLLQRKHEKGFRHQRELCCHTLLFRVTPLTGGTMRKRSEMGWPLSHPTFSGHSSNKHYPELMDGKNFVVTPLSRASPSTRRSQLSVAHAYSFGSVGQPGDRNKYALQNNQHTPSWHTLLLRVTPPTGSGHMTINLDIDMLSHPTFAGHSSNQ